MVKGKVFPSAPVVKRKESTIHYASFESDDQPKVSCSNSSTTQDSVNTGLRSKSDVDREVLMKKVVFGSEDFRNKSKEGGVEIVSVTTEEEDDSPKTDVTTDFKIYQIPSVEFSARLPVRNQETDILVKRCVDFIVVVKLE